MSFDVRRWAHRLGASVLFFLAIATANGQFTYLDAHDFGGTITNANGVSGSDGENPYSSLTFDASGNAYGTTTAGGANSGGMVWEITSAGVYKDLHDFGGTVTNADSSTGPDGSNPSGDVTFDTMGNMFGVASEGGPNTQGDASGSGLIWEISSAGLYLDLHDFGGTVTNADGTSGYDGAYPNGDVTFDGAGNMYGTATYFGPNNAGMVWEFTVDGLYKDLHDFGGTVTLSNGSSGQDGTAPFAGVSFNSAGDLFGTAEDGGLYGYGIAWELIAGGGYKDMHDFGGTVVNANGTSGPDGENPVAGVSLDSAGDRFGTANNGGGSIYGYGMVWEITSAGTYKDLHDFGGTVTLSSGSSGIDGEYPDWTVTLDSAGDIFGAASEGGGPNNSGMIWEIASNGTYKDLHDFGGTAINADGLSGSDGETPNGIVRLDSAGNLYGTAEYGGSLGEGMVWELEQTIRITGLTLSPSTIGGLGTSTATITLASAAPTGGWPIAVHAGASGYLNMPATVTVPAGATSATFTITGTAQRPSTINMGIFATDSSSTQEAILVIQGDSLKSFNLSPSQIKWTSGTSTATLTIGSAAPTGGWKVTLTPGVTGYVNIPTTVTIPAGSTSTTFSITGNALRFFTLNLGITASDGGSKATATLVIAGDAVKSITLSPSTIGWGGTSTATVNLVVAAPPGGWLVNTNPGAKGYVTMPSSITVPVGATSATFTVTAGSQRSSNLTMGIYANDGPSNQSATLTIQGDSVKSLTLNPSTITALGSSTATVTLASTAPPGGWVLTLHPGASGYVSMPTTLTVPAGATTATFTITGIVQHSSTINLGIFASDGNSSQEAVLTIT